MPETKRKILVCDPDKCVGCAICEAVCTIFKEKTHNFKKSRIRSIRIEPIFNMALSCRRCEKPVCVKACPRGAIKADDEVGGTIRIDEDKCNGCGWCIEVCPFGVLRLHINKKIVFACDFCEDEKNGPRCVEWCPREALTYTTLEQAARESQKKRFQIILEEFIQTAASD